MFCWLFQHRTLPRPSALCSPGAAVIGESLADAGTSWRYPATVSFYLHDGRTIAELDALFDAAVDAPCRGRECVAVEGYSSPGKLIEIEITATLPR